MNEPLDEIKYRGHTIKIYPDGYPDSPREWDNLGTMLLWPPAPDGDLTDEQRPRRLSTSEYDDKENFIEWWERDEHGYKLKRPRGIILPICYHSGYPKLWTAERDLNENMFDQADYGKHAGWIFATKETLRKAYSVKRVSKKVIEKATEVLIGEVKMYDAYISGQVYGFVIEYEDHEEDSLWGFYGDDDMWDYGIKEAKSLVDYYIDKAVEHHLKATRDAITAHSKQLKAWIRNRVPLIYRKPLALPEPEPIIKL